MVNENIIQDWPNIASLPNKCFCLFFADKVISLQTVHMMYNKHVHVTIHPAFVMFTVMETEVQKNFDNIQQCKSPV